MHLRFNECKTFTWQNGLLLFFFFSFRFWMMLQRLPAWAEQRDTAKQQEEYLGTLQESQGRSLVIMVCPPRQAETVFSLSNPKCKWVSSPAVKMFSETNTKEKRPKKKKKLRIPVISRLQRAVNINKRNVQVESVGWGFPTLSEPHGSFTPLFTSQPEQLAFSKSVSLRLHISASCPVFLFSLLFFCFLFYSLFPPSELQPSSAD